MKKSKIVVVLFIGMILGIVFSGCHLNPQKKIAGFFEPEEVKIARKESVPEKIEGHTEYYFQFLDEDEKRVYREMFQGIYEVKEKFYLSIQNNDSVNKIYFAVLADHPELYWAQNHLQTYTTSYSNTDYCEFELNYLYSAEEIEKMNQILEQVYQELVVQFPENATEYDKVKGTYEYLIEKIDYEYSEDDQNIAGALCNGKAVCAGYARAMQYLLEKLGIYCIYVDGDAVDSVEGHAWNIVQLSGEYYYIDVTNGDQQDFLKGDAASLAEHRTIVMDYLCPFPEEYEKNFIPSSTFPVPECTATDMNFYVLNQGCFENYDSEEIFNYCKMRIDNNAAVVRFKFSTADSYQKAKTALFIENQVEKIAQYYMTVYNLSSISYNYGLLEELNTIYIMF